MLEPAPERRVSAYLDHDARIARRDHAVQLAQREIGVSRLGQRREDLAGLGVHRLLIHCGPEIQRIHQPGRCTDIREPEPGQPRLWSRHVRI